MNEITVNEKSARFEWDIDGETVFLNYRILDERTWAYIYVFVPPALRGRNYATRLTRFAMEYAAGKNIKVKPVCPFVKAFATKNQVEFEEIIIV